MKKGIIIVVILIVLLVGGYFGYTLLTKTPSQTTVIPSEQFIDYGAVESISENEINTKLDITEPVEVDRGRQYKSDKYILTAKSEFYRISNQSKSETQFNQELENYEQTKRSNNSPGIILEAPTWFIEERIPYQEIKQDEKIKIYYHLDNQQKIVDKILAPKLVMAEPSEISQVDNRFSLLAKLKQINEDNLELYTIKENQADSLLFDQEFMVYFGDDLKIIKKENKSEAVFSKEVEEYNKQIKSTEDLSELSPPQPTTESTVALNEIPTDKELMIFGERRGDNDQYYAQRIEFIVN